MPIGFDEFQERLRDEAARRELLWVDGRPRYVLLSQLFSRADLDVLFATAEAVEALDRTDPGAAFLRSTLHRKRVVHLFAQPSTRTCESFVTAAEKLGASARVLSDVDATSLAKGESVEDTLRTLACFYDALVVRHPDATFAARAAWASSHSDRPIPVISAGSGTHEHPTQALLDLYTLHRAWGGRTDGKRLLLVGDIARNRAARSLALLLPRFSGIRLDIACQAEYRPEAAFVDALRRGGIEPRFHASIAEALSPDIDAIYMTRLQQEWDDGPAPLGTAAGFVLQPQLRERLRPDCLLLHPLPRVNELPDEWSDHPGFLIWHQVRNGAWVRAALLAILFGVDATIRHQATSHAGHSP